MLKQLGAVLAGAFIFAVTASAQPTGEEAGAQARALAGVIDAGLISRCEETRALQDQNPVLNDMVGFVATSTAGSDISSTYQALRQVEQDSNLCPTAHQAIALAKQLAVASICQNPTAAANFSEISCATGALASNGSSQPAASFQTGGAAPPSGSGY